MKDDPAFFWENVKQEIKRQNTTQDWVARKADINFNTFQGWIAKGIFPRLNEGARIASALNTSIEYLVSGSLRDNTMAIGSVHQYITQVRDHLTQIEEILRAFE